MGQVRLEFLNYVYWAIFALVHLGGLVAAIVLLTRSKGTPAILATAGFALLLINDAGQILRRWFLDGWIKRVILNYRFGPWMVNNCCCSALQVVAFVCLIVALWQAVSPVPGSESE
jgi:hypothetical protein